MAPSFTGVFNVIQLLMSLTPVALVSAQTASSLLGAQIHSNFCESNSQILEGAAHSRALWVVAAP